MRKRGVRESVLILYQEELSDGGQSQLILIKCSSELSGDTFVHIQKRLSCLPDDRIPFSVSTMWAGRDSLRGSVAHRDEGRCQPRLAL